MNPPVDVAGLIKERVGLFKDFAPKRIKELVDGSLVRSFEANEVIAPRERILEQLVRLNYV